MQHWIMIEHAVYLQDMHVSSFLQFVIADCRLVILTMKRKKSHAILAIWPIPATAWLVHQIARVRQRADQACMYGVIWPASHGSLIQLHQITGGWLILLTQQQVIVFMVQASQATNNQPFIICTDIKIKHTHSRWRSTSCGYLSC